MILGRQQLKAETVVFIIRAGWFQKGGYLRRLSLYIVTLSALLIEHYIQNVFTSLYSCTI